MQEYSDYANLDTVLFDMDGLLIDSESISQRTFNETISAFGLPDQSDLFLDLIGKNSNALVTTLTNALQECLDVTAFKNEWENRYLAIVENVPVPLKPGALELLVWLRKEEVKTAVATSTKTALAQLKLENAGLLDYFQIVVGGDQVTNSKPDPEIYLKAALAVSADNVNTAVLEDSSYGVQAGVAAEFKVIQVPDIVLPTPELLTLGHHVCADLHEVLELLKLSSQKSIE